MLFTDSFSPHRMEQMVRRISDLTLRGHGMVALHRYTYTTEECDCRLCLYRTSRGKKNACSLEQCCCFEERIEAGVAAYREIMEQVMSATQCPPCVKNGL